MITLSLGLINVNKYLMHSSRFPYAVPLVLIHMAVCSCVAVVMRLLAPSLFPSLTDATQRIMIDRDFIFKGLLPIAIFFSGSLVLTNMAYAKLSLAFLQMLKETNIIWTYLLSLAFGLEVLKLTSIKIIIVALIAMSLTIQGEMNFVLAGLFIQVSAILCEAVRVVLQALLLSGKKLDPLSYVLCVSPICGMLLGLVACGLQLLPADYAPDGMTMPSTAEVKIWAPWLLASSLIAFCLNVSIAALIKHSGPMTYLMCQLLKDLLAVFIGIVVLQEVVTGLQAIGFTMLLSCIFLWSMSKTFPGAFEPGLTSGLSFLLSVDGPLRKGQKAGEGAAAPGEKKAKQAV